jgi:hypothetical protein
MSFVPLGVLACLTVAAMVLSLNTSPRAAYFTSPEPGKPTVVKELHAALRATLSAPSFQSRSGGDAIDYQAPNRTKGIGPLGDIVIGHTAFLALSADGGTVTQWGEGPLVPMLNQTDGPESVLLGLEDLLSQNSVTLHGDLFTVGEVVPAEEVDPLLTGQVLVVTTVKVHNGYVVSIHPVFHVLLLGRHRSTVKKVSGQTVTYSEFGKVPSITAPRRNIIRLHPCPDGAVMNISGSHVCGL